MSEFVLLFLLFWETTRRKVLTTYIAPKNDGPWKRIFLSTMETVRLEEVSNTLGFGIPKKTIPRLVWVFHKEFLVTPRKTNMSPEHQWLEDVFLIEIVHFFRRHVRFRGCTFDINIV